MSALLEVDDLVVQFPGRGFRARPFRAVRGVSFTVLRGGAVGIVGESGSGKSTTAAAVIGLVPAHSGVLRFDGADIGGRRRNASLRGRIQMVFQDPAGALNPRMTVRQILAEIVAVTDRGNRSAIDARVTELMSLVELPSEFLDRLPRALSGGQRQRASIARALASRPELLILDEAIAALDVSVQAAIMALLARLKDELGLSIVFISHNLGAVRILCEEIVVMCAGEAVEQGATEEVLSHPSNEYTQRLVAAEPRVTARSAR